MLNAEQTKLLVQILENLIGDYDKVIAMMEDNVSPENMQLKMKRKRQSEIEEIVVAIKNLDAEFRLSQAEHQLTGFYHSERADTIEELVTAMGLTKEEVVKLRVKIPTIIEFIENSHDTLDTIIENWEQFNK